MNQDRIKIGIIGGAGPYASALLYEMILDQCYESQGAKVPELILLNFPFTRGLSMDESDKHALILKSEIQYCIDALHRCGIAIVAIACNTLHHFLEEVDLQGIHLIHLPELVKEKICNSKINKFLVLGTQTTINSQLYSHSHAEVVNVNRDEQQIVDSIIDRILQGKILQSDATKLLQLIVTIHSRSPFEGVVLGCTELPVLHRRHSLECAGIKIFDSIQILAKKLSNI